ISGQQLQYGEIPCSSVVVRIDGNGAFVDQYRFVEALELSEGGGLVAKDCSGIWLEQEGLVEPSERLVGPFEADQSIADIIAADGVDRIKCVGPHVFGEAFLE